ncbi:MAG TPA: alpha-amylase family glycosyl hydrolase [Albitalea sp.]|nr:alpha-amylase family glycosyl hydrolase [Albitalea sp.]
MLKHTLRTRCGLIAAASLALAACGGGGSSAAASDTPLPTFDASAVAKADPGSTLPAQWQSGVFMEIYVRGYKDSNGDGIGDLKGLTQSLDYLKDLGVSGIWLMPITRSQDHDHGYAVTDYRDIETQYGSLADFDELLAQAHARGIGVVIDYVMNHSAAQHPAFVNSNASPSNPYRDWYLWQASEPAGWSIYGNDPWYPGASGFYFAGFWSQMPDFNLLNPSVVAYHHDSMRFWLNRGVDGFRFDAVGNLVENGPSAWEKQPQDYTLMSDVRQMLAGYAQRFMVCEGPADPIGFSNACGSAFAFGHSNDVVAAAKGSATAVKAVSDYFTTAPATMSTMVSNHDSFAGQRLYDQVGGNLAQYRLAAATYLLQPGTPFIYYGEEVGMAGAASLSGDWKLRTPMSWSADTRTAGFTTGTPFRALSGNVAAYNVAGEAADANSLLAFYKSVIALRKSRPSLARGIYEAAASSGTVMSFQRSVAGERTLVVFNYGSSAASVALANLRAGAVLTPLMPTGGADVNATASGSASVDLPAQSFAVYAVH